MFIFSQNMSVIACMQLGEQKDNDFLKKRAILFMGISIFSMLKFRGYVVLLVSCGFLIF